MPCINGNRIAAAATALFPPVLPALLSALLLLAGLAAAPAAEAQDPPEPVTAYQDADLKGIFCAYDVSESGDSPDTIAVVNDKGRQNLYFFTDIDVDNRAAESLAAGTPVVYSIIVLYAYHEAAGEMFTFIGATSLETDSARPPDPEACQAQSN
ncbi:MAG: hypothetical protein LBW85_02995 [Deltaproteobacteria bacterium]|jgi:hypothetical protein|nr:hypothetical protein [Deltaproteobacteria bacterium]